MVVGTADGIVMIESGAKEVSEELVVDAIDFGHTEIKKICAAINDLRAKAGKKKREVTPPEFDQKYYDDLKKKVGAELSDALDTKKHPKAESYTLVKDIKKKLQAEIPEDDEKASREAEDSITKRCASESSARKSSKRSVVQMPALSTKFATSGSKPESCPAPTAAQSSPAAKPKPW